MTGRLLKQISLLAAFLGVLLAACASAPAPRDPPKLFVAGDSTAATYSSNGSGATDKVQQGWGALLQGYFDPAKLVVVNAARGTIPGIGNESEEIDNVVTGKHETVYSFGWYLRRMIADTRSKGATPIVMTLTRTNTWKDGRIDCPSETYRLWDWQVARDEKVAFVDLSRIIADRYQREGADAVTAQFINDTVHTNVAGAERNAADATSALKTLRGRPFRKMLSARGRVVHGDRGPGRDSVCPKL
jgi:lysophospholipase L1-like esterase